MENGNIGNSGLGNTNTKPLRIVPSKKWCFTLNNYTDEDLETLETQFKNDLYIIGKEIGEQGTPHLQGYVEFNKKVRPSEHIKNKRIHWEKTKGNKEQNIEYCTKDNNYVTNIKFKKPLKDPLEGKELYEYQKEILELIKTEPNDRTINWYWEDEGNVGKSALTKHILMNYKAIMVTGKGNDIKHGIAEYILKNEEVDIVIMDFERSLEEYVNYSAIEQIKNGCFFSGKYESNQVLFNSPHIIVFANFKPEKDKLSRDRWNIKRIE